MMKPDSNFLCILMIFFVQKSIWAYYSNNCDLNILNYICFNFKLTICIFIIQQKDRYCKQKEVFKNKKFR